MAEETSAADSAVGTPVPAVAVDDAPVGGAPAQNLDTPQKDTVMAEASNENVASSPAPAAPSPAPGRTGTPAQGSRAASAHPDPTVSFPAEAPPHGDQTRRYLNTKVTGVLLEGMKQIAKDQPNEPLKALGEYLLQKSKELEGTS